MRILFSIGCLAICLVGPARAEVKIENCDTFNGTSDRLKCLQRNDAAMKIAIDALQLTNDKLAKGLEDLKKAVADLPKPPSLDKVVKYGDGLVIYHANENPGRGFVCMMGNSMAECNLENPNLGMRFQLSPTTIPR